MAHPTEGAVDAPVTHTVDSAAAALRGIAGEIAGEEQEEQPVEEEINPDDGDIDPEIEVEGDEGDIEPETVIEAPVSLSSDAKEVFAGAPPEIQEVWRAEELRRNEQVQEATTRAAQREQQARTLAEVAAREELASERIEWLRSNFEPQPPDAMLVQTDPMAYNAQLAQYDATKRVFDTEIGKLDSERAKAEQEHQQEFWKQRDEQLAAMPEFDEGNRQNSIEKLVKIAQDYSIPGERLKNDADASDWKILLDLANFKEKADKYDALVAKSKQRKRDAKGKFRSQKPGAGQPNFGTQNQAVTKAKQRLAETGSRDDAQAAIRAMLG